MPKRWRQAAIVLVAVAAAAALLITLLADADRSRVEAQTADTPTPAPTSAPVEENESEVSASPILDGKTNPPQYGNMDGVLNGFVADLGQGLDEQSIAESALMSMGTSVGVGIIVEEGHESDVIQYIEDNGGSIRQDAAGYIEAYVPVSELGAVSELEGVTTVQALTPPKPLQGDVVGEGAIVHGADVWQAAGFRGEGIKIGIIDVGFIGFEDALGNELPTADRVHALCFDESSDVFFDIEECEWTTTHGTVVTESAFDIAPEATYYISNPGTRLELRLSAEWMAAQGVDVVNHSVGWIWLGPGDGTSIYPYNPLETVDIAAANGILWANAAGNEGESTWTGAYHDPDGNKRHNFQGGDECNAILMESGDRLNALLRWDDIWGAPQSDLDLRLLDQRTGEPVSTSESFQILFPLPL